MWRGTSGAVEAEFSPSKAGGHHPTADPDLAVLARPCGACSGFPSEPSPTDQWRGLVEPP